MLYVRALTPSEPSGKCFYRTARRILKTYESLLGHLELAVFDQNCVLSRPHTKRCCYYAHEHGKRRSTFRKRQQRGHRSFRSQTAHVAFRVKERCSLAFLCRSRKRSRFRCFCGTQAVLHTWRSSRLFAVLAFGIAVDAKGPAPARRFDFPSHVRARHAHSHDHARCTSNNPRVRVCSEILAEGGFAVAKTTSLYMSGSPRVIWLLTPIHDGGQLGAQPTFLSPNMEIRT